VQPERAAATGVAPDPRLDLKDSAYRRWALVFAAVAGSLLVVMAVPALAGAIQPIDDWFWELAVGHEYPVLVSAAEAFALIGGTVAMAVATVAGASVLAWQRRWTAFALWLFVIIVATGVNAMVKAIYERSRPPLGLTEEHSWSFASGHSLTAAVMALMVVLVWVPAGPLRRRLLVVGSVYALLMAASRVYLRVHWFTDVTAGLAIGAATALGLLLLASWWTVRSGD
jgi:undecaprenyl-diphosphatase